jgi:prepilin-type N-terminal cleavage/methylation domain-containing protein/prepilin-type processing-associated H-X9-DG protein
MWPRRKNGFTLIELLVVIAIILVLAAVLYPVFAMAQQAAVRNTCANHMRQIALAFHQYAGDNGGKVPPYFLLGMMNPVQSNPPCGTLFRYMKTGALAQCPAATPTMGDAYFPRLPIHSGASGPKYHLTYGLNFRFTNGGQLGETVSGGQRVPVFTHNSRPQMIDSPPIPTRTIFLVESQLRADWTGEAGEGGGQGAAPAGCGGDAVFGDWGVYFWAIRWLDYPYVPFGHTGGCNIVMADSHLKFVKAPRPNPTYPPDYSYLEQPQIGLRWW